MQSEKIETSKLSLNPVDPTSPLPLYYQIYQDLKGIILTGKLEPGDQLPPELELCKSYHVGRQTVREAILRLVNERLLERYAGRGTFVRARLDRAQFYLDRSFTQQMADMGLAAHSKVLEISTGLIDDHAPPSLQRKNGSPCLYLSRLRFGDRQPVGVQISVVLMEQCPGLENFDFNTESLYAILSEAYHLQINMISHIVSAQAATILYADLLQTQPGVPVLVVRTTAFLQDGEPIESTTSYYRADKYEFSTTHTYNDCV